MLLSAESNIPLSSVKITESAASTEDVGNSSFPDVDAAPRTTTDQAALSSGADGVHLDVAATECVTAQPATNSSLVTPDGKVTVCANPEQPAMHVGMFYASRCSRVAVKPARYR